MPENHGSLKDFAARLRNRIGASTADACRDCEAIPQRAEIETVNRAAEALAKELGLWMSYADALALGNPYPSGMENDVFLDTTTHTVVKINNLMTSHTVLRLFDRLMLHNEIFPQTAYTLVGFTGFGGGRVYPILRQPFVPQATYATHGEILDYMESLGFTADGEARFVNERYVITDLRPRNVLKGEYQTLFVVDADFQLRQSEV